MLLKSSFNQNKKARKSKHKTYSPEKPDIDEAELFKCDICAYSDNLKTEKDLYQHISLKHSYGIELNHFGVGKTLILGNGGNLPTVESTENENSSENIEN